MAKVEKITPKAPEATKVVEESILQAARETHRMSTVERVHHWDRLQARQHWADGNGAVLPPTITEAELDAIPGKKRVPHPDVICCGNDRKHGVLQVHGSGAVLICQQRAPQGGSYCNYTQPISI